MGSLKIARIMGIDIKLHFTFSLLLLWGMLTGGWPLVLLLLLVFVCVALHELGHCYFTLRFGGAVKDIVLTPLGGIARMTAIPDKPAQEIIIALAGPAVNYVIAFALFAVFLRFHIPTLAEVDHAFDHSDSLDRFPLMLLYFNVFIGTFNLLPAFPMDGGRVFRALLTLKLGYFKATVWSVKVSRLFSVLFVVWFLYDGRLWLVLIGVFLWLLSASELGAAKLREYLKPARVMNVMSRPEFVFYPHDVPRLVLDKLLVAYQDYFPVMDLEKPIGILSRESFAAGMRRYGVDATAGQCMMRLPPAVAPEESLYDAYMKMLAAHAPALPVMHEGRFVGLVTHENISRFADLADKLFAGKGPTLP